MGASKNYRAKYAEPRMPKHTMRLTRYHLQLLGFANGITINYTENIEKG